MTNDLNILAIAWRSAKHEENEAVAARRRIEDQMISVLGIQPSLEGMVKAETPDYTVRVTNRLTRKVDSDLVQEIAAEHNLSEYLPKLFRWKPEISMSAWKAAPPEVTTTLQKAITTTAGRPSFAIDTKE